MPEQKLTVEALRRKAVGAKSYLSRLDHQVDMFFRTVPQGSIDDYCKLVEKRNAQAETFRAAIRAWKEQSNG